MLNERRAVVVSLVNRHAGQVHAGIYRLSGRSLSADSLYPRQDTW